MTSDLLKSYASTDLEGKVAGANPHGLVSLLIDGAIEKVVVARAHMQHGNIAAKGSSISWAISILDGLRSGLDFEKGGEIATNLDALYEYMERRLLLANVNNDERLLAEVGTLLETIKSGWDTIPAEFRKISGD